MHPISGDEQLSPMESAFFEAWQASSTYKLCSRDIMSGSHLALPARCWIVYFSCLTELFTFSNYSDAVQENRKASCPANPSGPRGIRTLDLFNAIEARSQLRHGPFLIFRRGRVLPPGPVDLAGFEPATSSVRLKRAPTALQAPAAR